MKYKIRDITEYMIAIISDFSVRFNLSERQAYNYLKFHDGISFIKKNYGIMHTLDFNEAVESVAVFCRKSGGEL